MYGASCAAGQAANATDPATAAANAHAAALTGVVPRPFANASTAVSANENTATTGQVIPQTFFAGRLYTRE